MAANNRWSRLHTPGMAPRPDPLPPSLRSRAFHVQEAQEWGVSGSRLRANDLVSPFAGVRVSEQNAPQGLASLALAYLPKMRPTEFFSHATAAVLHGMWLPLALEESAVLDVSVRKPARAPRDRGVHGHHLIDRPGLVEVKDGLRVAGPVETWCQLATQLRIPELVAAGDSLLTPERRDIAVMHDRLLAAASDPSRPMHIRLTRAVALIRPRVRSPRETALRLILVLGGLPEPEINVPIFDEQGRFVAESDIVYREQRVLFEYEGDYHRLDKRKFRKDITRYDRLQDLGWRTVRVTEDDLRAPTLLLERARRAFFRR